MEIPLAEYIRNRRMSEAGHDLCNTNDGILDIAVKYGYNSQEAFARAFMKFHGMTPRQAREANTNLTFYPVASFMYKEEKSMNSKESSYMLNRKPTAEQFKNKAPSPITLNFPVSLWTYMEFMGQNTNTMQNYTLIANLCGDTMQAGLALTDDNGIMTVLEAFGYTYTICSTKEGEPNYISEAKLKKKIINEILTNQRPVIAVNVVDCCFGGIIMGYKENGECLMNWGYFPFDFSENPEPVITECKDWYKKTQKVIFIGKNEETPSSLKNMYIYTLKKLAQYIGDATHLATEVNYIEWRKQLLEREMILNNDCSIVDPMWCDYAEKRFYAGQFMLQLRSFLPEYEDQLVELWSIFGRELNALMYDYIAKVGLEPGAEIESINYNKLQDLKVRKEMADIVSKCEEKERIAAQIITDLAEKLS